MKLVGIGLNLLGKALYETHHHFEIIYQKFIQMLSHPANSVLLITRVTDASAERFLSIKSCQEIICGPLFPKSN